MDQSFYLKKWYFYTHQILCKMVAQPEQPEVTEIKPEAGFCIKTRVANSEKDGGQKAFINITSHVMVDPPLNAMDKPVNSTQL